MEYGCLSPVIAASLSSTTTPLEPQCGGGLRSGSDSLSSTLPSGFPRHLDGPLGWSEHPSKFEDSFLYCLGNDDKSEIRAALAQFKAFELDGDRVSRETFVLPTLGPKLMKMGLGVYEGTGLCVIRGLSPDDYPVEDQTTVWLGIQAYIADQRGRQDHCGNMLVHIIADNSLEMKLGHHRHSTTAISFHNEEAGDIVGWLTRSTAASGGRCILASAYAIYNILAHYRPDIIRTLAKSDWPIALPRFQCRPLIFYHESRLIMNFGRTPLLGNATHPRPEHLPKLNDRQREALDVVEAIARAIQFEFQTQAGDMHFINNFAILHRREGFVDGAGSHEKRHLVRMRLRSSELGWSVPHDLQREWHEAFEKDACKTWHLEPMPGDAFPLRNYTN